RVILLRIELGEMTDLEVEDARSCQDPGSDSGGTISRGGSVLYEESPGHGPGGAEDDEHRESRTSQENPPGSRPRSARLRCWLKKSLQVTGQFGGRGIPVCRIKGERLLADFFQLLRCPSILKRLRVVFTTLCLRRDLVVVGPLVEGPAR